MPEVILVAAILILVAVALRSMLHAVAAVRLDLIEKALEGEEPEISDDVSITDFGWIHQKLVDGYAAESEPWALEQATRVDARLQAAVAPEERLETVILWMPEATAFTFPGRYLYLGRKLMERARGDEPVAFVVAHEMAHHHLGHLDVSGALFARLPGLLQALVNDLVASRWFVENAEREAETDVHALNLCMAAGYDARRCLTAFDLLEEIALDWGDTEGVFGPDAAIESALAGDPEWMVRGREWLAERRRGYPAIRERKARLLAALELAEAEEAAAG